MAQDFDFLENMQGFEDMSIGRLQKRHKFILEPFVKYIKGGSVLDIAAHDGRWSYPLAAAGAKSVLGIEGRKDLVDRFQALPDDPIKQKVTLEVGDLYDTLDLFSSTGRKFDVITLYGIMYHVMDHFGILRKCLKMQPKVIIVDSEFMKGDNPYIQLVKESTAQDINATSQVDGQQTAITGVPSSLAMDRMAEALNCTNVWQPWEDLPKENRSGVHDYFRGEKFRKIRRTCAFFPN